MTTHDTTHIPEWWRETTLGEIVTIWRWSSPRPIQDYLSDFGIPWVKISDATASQNRFIEWTKEYIKEEGRSTSVQPGDLIVSNSATPWIPKFMRIHACVHDWWLVFSNYKELNNDYLYYFFLDYRRHLEHSASWTVFKNLTTDIVRHVPILLPPLPEQRAIADMLSSLDAKIELLREQNETLEKIAQTIFHEWFGRYSVESPEELPQGWRVGKLGEVADIKWGKRLSQWDNLVGYKTDHPYIRITDLTWNWIKKENLQYIEDQVFSKISRYIVNNGDIILSIVGSIGSVARIDDELDNANLTENCVKFVNLKNIGSNYLFNFLISELWQGEIIRNTVWAVQKKLPIYGIQNMEILIPTKDIIQRFEEIVGEFSIKIFSNNSQIQSLSKNRDTILPKLMGGEVNIND